MRKIVSDFKWFVALVVMLQTSTAFAQWRVGVHAGYTNNSLSVSSSYDYDRNYNDRGGFAVGIPVQYNFVDWFAVQADLSYVQKNYKIEKYNTYNKWNSSIQNAYLQLPVYAQFLFGGKKLKGFVNVGAYLGYWVSSRIKGNQNKYSGSLEDDDVFSFHSFNEKVPFDSRRDNRLEAGLMAGLGLKYQITDRAQVFAEGRYYRGLTDIQKEYMLKQIHRYNDTFAVQLGCMFTVGRLK